MCRKLTTKAGQGQPRTPHNQAESSTFLTAKSATSSPCGLCQTIAPAPGLLTRKKIPPPPPPCNPLGKRLTKGRKTANRLIINNLYQFPNVPKTPLFCPKSPTFSPILQVSFMNGRVSRVRVPDDSLSPPPTGAQSRRREARPAIELCSQPRHQSWLEGEVNATGPGCTNPASRPSGAGLLSKRGVPPAIGPIHSSNSSDSRIAACDFAMRISVSRRDLWMLRQMTRLLQANSCDRSTRSGLGSRGVGNSVRMVPRSVSPAIAIDAEFGVRVASKKHLASPRRPSSDGWLHVSSRGTYHGAQCTRFPRQTGKWAYGPPPPLSPARPSRSASSLRPPAWPARSARPLCSWPSGAAWPS